MKTTIISFGLFLYSSLLNAQYFHESKIVDSLRLSAKNQSDSIWFIRKETRAEHTEELMFLVFRDTNICINTYSFDNYRLMIRHPFNHCLTLYVNKMQLQNVITEYRAQFAWKVDLNNFIPRVRIGFEFNSERFEKLAGDSDNIFTSDLMKITLSDYQGIEYVTGSSKKNKKRKK
jgi:hypothetical protein